MYILSGLEYCFEYNYIDLKLKIKIIEANDAFEFQGISNVYHICDRNVSERVECKIKQKMILLIFLSMHHGKIIILIYMYRYIHVSMLYLHAYSGYS